MSLFDRTEKKDFGPSKTKQEFKQECDVNLIMKRFKKTCGADFLSRYNGYVGGQFGDFSEVTDYRSALEQISQAKAVFGALPAKVRARFENDAAQFLDFVQNPKNADEMISMGLAKSISKKPDVVGQPVAGSAKPNPPAG